MANRKQPKAPRPLDHSKGHLQDSLIDWGRYDGDVARKRVRRTDKYYRAVGHIIDLFASTEDMLVTELARLCGVSDPVAQAIFSGTRVDAAMSLIKRVLDAKGATAEEREPYEIAFEQLRLLNSARNEIVHHGAHLTLDWEFFITNFDRTHTENSVRTYVFTLQMLDDIAFDLTMINSFFNIRGIRRFVAQMENEDMRKDFT
jgi:hypothetical protein